MIVAQGRFWRAEVRKGSEAVTLSILREGVRDAFSDADDLRDLRIEVPLSEWTRVVKHLRADRKLLGGILLDFARDKDALPGAIGRDRLFHALQEVVADATTCLVEEGLLTLVPVGETRGAS
jgi:hypothetical protein